MVKETIAKELHLIKILKHIKTIVVDIWHEDDMNADTYYAEVMNDESKDIDACDLICECVSTECNAIGLARHAGNDIKKLTDLMEGRLKEIESTITSSDDADGGDNTGDDDTSGENDVYDDENDDGDQEIGRASCRERV